MKITKPHLKQIIKEEIQKLNESYIYESVVSKSDKVYVLRGNLWLSWSPNSGQTVNISKKKYITDSPGDTNYDSLAPKLIKWFSLQSPIFKKKSTSLYRIPVYSSTKAEDYDIWGGDVVPDRYLYLVISGTKKFNIIDIFDNKQEAVSWVTSRIHEEVAISMVSERKCTVKTIRDWLKSLPENKWRKTYNIDARRISHFVNEGDVDTLPVSLRRRGESVSYDREMSLANKYLEYLSGLNEESDQSGTLLILESPHLEVFGTAKELDTYIKNSSKLNKQVYDPIIKNLSKKYKQDKYNTALGIRTFSYLVNTAAKLYTNEYGGVVSDLFPKKVLLNLSHYYTTKFEDKILNSK